MSVATPVRPAKIPNTVTSLSSKDKELFPTGPSIKRAATRFTGTLRRRKKETMSAAAWTNRVSTHDVESMVSCRVDYQVLLLCVYSNLSRPGGKARLTRQFCPSTHLFRTDTNLLPSLDSITSKMVMMLRMVPSKLSVRAKGIYHPIRSNPVHS